MWIQTGGQFGPYRIRIYHVWVASSSRHPRHREWCVRLLNGEGQTVSHPIGPGDALMVASYCARTWPEAQLRAVELWALYAKQTS